MVKEKDQGWGQGQEWVLLSPVSGKGQGWGQDQEGVLLSPGSAGMVECYRGETR